MELHKQRFLKVFKYVGICDQRASVKLFGNLSKNLSRIYIHIHEKYRFPSCELSQSYICCMIFHTNGTISPKF